MQAWLMQCIFFSK